MVNPIFLSCCRDFGSYCVWFSGASILTVLTVTALMDSILTVKA